MIPSLGFCCPSLEGTWTSSIQKFESFNKKWANIDDKAWSFMTQTQGHETIVFNTNTNAIALPLLIGDEGVITTSRFILEKDTDLRLDEDDTTNSDVDIIEISYTTEFVYVSRACGYKSIFNNVDINIEATDGSFWINNIEVLETTIENENTVHVSILH